MAEGQGARAATTHPSFAVLCASEEAFTTWYELALPRVFGFVYGRTGGDSTLAEEITAQAFMEAVRARRSFEGRADPVSWICSIARNRLIDHYRRLTRERRQLLHLVAGDPLASDSRAMNDVDDRDTALSILSTLPALERTALMLRYLDGYSVRETASMIGRSVPATESLLMRARERVRATFPGGPA